MPPTRTKKYKERLELALLIEAHGFIMPSCSFCERLSRNCIVSSEDSTRCNECVRRGGKCDVAGPSARDMASLLREQERLDQEDEATLNKLFRLRKQKKLLRDRASEMIRRGLQTLDELDAIEEKERLEKEYIEQEQRERLVQSPSSMPGPNEGVFAYSSLVDLDLNSPSNAALLVDLGIADETPPISQGN
jgi:hypothetical protein